MRKYLDNIRKPVFIPVSKQIRSALLILLTAIILGIISKILDETAGNLLPPLLEMLDLRNFLSRMGFWMFSGICISIYSKTPFLAAWNTFLFFSGMVGGYYAYTIMVAGFYPKSYMMIWIVMTILSPFMGTVCWYAKGTHGISLCISAVMLLMMSRQAFAFGFWYFDIRNILELLLWIATIAVLCKTQKQMAMVLGAAILLFFITSPLNLFWGML